MKLAYVDTSCLVAIAFGEPGARRLARRLEGYDRLLASNLLEAELRAALLREKVDDRAEVLISWMTWVYPDRPLTPEFKRIAAAGYLKGADMWHLAHALFLAPDAKGLDFLTLDQRQREVSTRLGFGGTARP
ncbi:MAG: PIN domain-containing protein [Armatimonadetes bacterium]|nr:PIN domain-containing protein [Armatimonadota bacterium]